MNCADFHTRIQSPAQAFAATLLPAFANPSANLLLLAIAGQESGWTERRQIAGGPARGFWQTEPNGVLALLQNPQTQRYAINAARAQSVGIDRASIYIAIEHNDPLAFACARLLLWADPHPLPEGEEAGWETYLRCWRPGRPDRDRWAAVYPQAADVFNAAAAATEETT